MSQSRIQTTLSDIPKTGIEASIRTSITAHEFMESAFTEVLGGATLETDSVRDEKSLNVHNDKNLLKIASKNTLLYLERSVKMMSGQGYDNAMNVMKHAFMEQRNPDFIGVLSEQFYALLHNMANRLTAGQVFKDSDEEEKIRILVSCLTAFIPLFEPSDGTVIHIPVRVNGQWQAIKYAVSKVDISPKSGPLAKLIEEQDRLYDYILEPQGDYAKDVPNIVAIMGTPPAMIRGSDLANLNNNKPYHSFGEGHHLEAIGDAMRKNGRKNVVVGHSQGAVMSMIITAKYPDLVERADCLNPCALCESTLQRFKQVTPAVWSKVNVYEQLGDPVFSIEKGFPRGIHIYGIIDPHFEESVAQYGQANRSGKFKFLEKKAQRFADGLQKRADLHIRYLVAHRDAKVIPLDVEAENHSREREFFNDLKETMNKLVFATRYTGLCKKIITRKAARTLGITEQVEAMDRSVPGKVINAGMNVVEATVFTAVAAPLVLLTASYSGLKIFGKSACTDSYRYTASPHVSQPADEINSDRLQPKKWNRHELPTNLNFKEKAEIAKKQLSPASYAASVFGLWAQEKSASSLTPPKLNLSELKPR